jgi:hypothetical protein
MMQKFTYNGAALCETKFPILNLTLLLRQRLASRAEKSEHVYAYGAPVGWAAMSETYFNASPAEVLSGVRKLVEDNLPPRPGEKWEVALDTVGTIIEAWEPADLKPSGLVLASDVERIATDITESFGDLEPEITPAEKGTERQVALVWSDVKKLWDLTGNPITDLDTVEPVG